MPELDRLLTLPVVVVDDEGAVVPDTRTESTVVFVRPNTDSPDIGRPEEIAVPVSDIYPAAMWVQRFGRLGFEYGGSVPLWNSHNLWFAGYTDLLDEDIIIWNMLYSGNSRVTGRPFDVLIVGPRRPGWFRDIVDGNIPQSIENVNGQGSIAGLFALYGIRRSAGLGLFSLTRHDGVTFTVPESPGSLYPQLPMFEQRVSSATNDGVIHDAVLPGASPALPIPMDTVVTLRDSRTRVGFGVGSTVQVYALAGPDTSAFGSNGVEGPYFSTFRYNESTPVTLSVNGADEQFGLFARWRKEPYSPYWWLCPLRVNRNMPGGVELVAGAVTGTIPAGTRISHLNTVSVSTDELQYDVTWNVGANPTRLVPDDAMVARYWATQVNLALFDPAPTDPNTVIWGPAAVTGAGLANLEAVAFGKATVPVDVKLLRPALEARSFSALHEGGSNLGLRDRLARHAGWDFGVFDGGVPSAARTPLEEGRIWDMTSRNGERIVNNIVPYYDQSFVQAVAFEGSDRRRLNAIRLERGDAINTDLPFHWLRRYPEFGIGALSAPVTGHMYVKHPLQTNWHGVQQAWAGPAIFADAESNFRSQRYEAGYTLSNADGSLDHTPDYERRMVTGQVLFHHDPSPAPYTNQYVSPAVLAGRVPISLRRGEWSVALPGDGGLP